MPRLLVVVDKLKDWAPYFPSEDVISFSEYLALSPRDIRSALTSGYQVDESGPALTASSAGGRNLSVLPGQTGSLAGTHGMTPEGQHAGDGATGGGSAIAATASGTNISRSGRIRVVNLCRHYRYLSQGYYCSLLAEARGHHVIPSVSTLNTLAKRSMFQIVADFPVPNLTSALVTHAGSSRYNVRWVGEDVYVRSYFGESEIVELQRLTEKVFEQFPCPIFDIHLRFKDKWQVVAVEPIAMSKLVATEESQFARAFNRFSLKIWRKPRERARVRYDMAVLVNPEEPFPPSDKDALARLKKAGKKFGVAVEFIGPRDMRRLPEFDMLFIRETTALTNHTFKFARKAEAEGLIVLDDPTSIMRCTNKVYLADLLAHNNVPTPHTLILQKHQPDQLVKAAELLGFPMVVKIPDGSFSRGVARVENTEDLQVQTDALFKQSSLLLAQEYMYTDFDWRIGILDGKPLYACKYFMAREHWQIYHHSEDTTVSGNWETLPVEEVPDPVLDVATRAANLIGNGLYGVDLKQIGDRVVIIEVNDNPNIDGDVEDHVLGAKLYEEILATFITRADQRRGY